MDAIKGILAFLAVMLFLIGLGWAFKWNDFAQYSVFAPKEEQVRRQTYEQTKSFRQGSIQRLNELCTQVASADDGHRPMLNDVISHEFAEWNMQDVPGYLQGCVATARSH